MKKRILFITVPVLTLALALSTGSVLLLRLFAVMLLTVLAAYAWAALGIRGLSSRSKKSAEYVQAGESFDEAITVSSSTALPKPLLKAVEKTEIPGHHNEASFNLSPMGSHRWESSVRSPRRGRFSLGAVTVTASDPFGFFSFHRDLGEPHNIIVYPATKELPFFQSLSHKDTGFGSSRWLTSEVGPNASRVREYTSGDTLNRVHWRSTAHTGKLMVKEFDAESSNYASKNVWIVLDMNGASQAGQEDDSTEEYGVTIAASLIKKFIDSGKHVGLMAAGDQAPFFTPQPGEMHLWDMMKSLAEVKACGEVPVEKLIQDRLDSFGTDTVAIVITPAAPEKILGALRQIKSKGAPVIVIALDYSSFAGSGPAINTRNLAASGFQTYVVRKGDALGRTLDSRSQIPQASLELEAVEG